MVLEVIFKRGHKEGLQKKKDKLLLSAYLSLLQEYKIEGYPLGYHI